MNAVAKCLVGVLALATATAADLSAYEVKATSSQGAYTSAVSSFRREKALTEDAFKTRCERMGFLVVGAATANFSDERGRVGVHLLPTDNGVWVTYQPITRTRVPDGIISAMTASAVKVAYEGPLHMRFTFSSGTDDGKGWDAVLVEISDGSWGGSEALVEW